MNPDTQRICRMFSRFAGHLRLAAEDRTLPDVRCCERSPPCTLTPASQPVPGAKAEEIKMTKKYQEKKGEGEKSPSGKKVIFIEKKKKKSRM